MKFIILITLLLALPSCQTLMENNRKTIAALCTYDGAYSKGVGHAENEGQSKASKTLSSCSSDVITQAMKGYNAGYASVRKQQNSTVGGLLGKFFDSRISKTKKSSDGLHMCEIDVFTDTFSAKGNSRAEALYNAKNICTTSYDNDDFFCKNKSKYKCKKLY